MEPTKDRITPEQFYSESKWPEMKDKFDKSALLFHYYDLCQFANDYAKHYRNVIKLTTEDKERISIDAEEYVSNLFGTDADGAWRRNAAKDYIAGATAEHERLEKDQDYIDLKETIGSAQQELQAYRDEWILSRERMPDVDGEYLVAGWLYHECGNITQFQKVVTCRFNQWVKNDVGEQMTYWRPLLPMPKLIDTVTPTSNPEQS